MKLRHPMCICSQFVKCSVQMVNVTWFSVSDGFITYTVGNFVINSENNVDIRYRIPSE